MYSNGLLFLFCDLLRLGVGIRFFFFFFFQAEDGIRDKLVTGVQTCALPISRSPETRPRRRCRTRAEQWRAPTARRRAGARPRPAPCRTASRRRGSTAAREREIGRASCRERV